MADTHIRFDGTLPASLPGGSLELAARLGARLLDVPAVAIGIRSPDGSWTCQGVGWKGGEPPFLRETLDSDGMFVHSGPVPGVDGIRFVAALCLDARGGTPGVLTVMDTLERELTPEQCAILEHLGMLVADALRMPAGVELAPVSTGAVGEAGEALLDQASQLARAGEHLRELHRLATTEYAGLDQALGDYLRTGCQILGLPLGIVTERGGERAQLRASHPPTAGFSEAGLTALERLESASPVRERETFTYPCGAGSTEAPFACIITTPIRAGEVLFGRLSFCSTPNGDVRRFSAHDREILELMAKSLGRSVYEDQLRRERARLEVELARQAQQDPLTGLLNRGAFMKHLDSALAAAAGTGGPLAVAFLDLDRFKQVNDTLGHASGDEMLQQVSARLASEAGSEERVARVGGDEFTILFAGNPTRAGVAITAQRLIEVLRAPYRLGATELFITASMGISFFPGDATDARELLQKADAAMYRAKSQGKNDFRFFTPDIVLRGANRMELETQLRRAIEKDELRVCFMPLVAAQAAALGGLEALLAWKNPRFGNVGPARFIPIAEEAGLIVPIGTWVLHEVCRLGADWRRMGLEPVRVAVNVSATQFARADFVELVSEALRQSGMPPAYLELELTESTVMRDVEAAARRMSQLRDLGVSISIDDFGTGYSSLSYLRRLPADTLKIDQSFVAEVGVSGTALPLIHTIVVLAHNIGLTVVAEGVETREQADLLRAAGCDKLQGHLFGGPLTPEAVEALMRRPARDVPFRR